MNRDKPFVGMEVCVHDEKHMRIVKLEEIHGDYDLIMEDGSSCSYEHCTDPIANCYHTRPGWTY